MHAFASLRSYRSLLWTVAFVGFFGLNAVFVYYATVYPDVMIAALRNPVSLVFILEAFLMTGLIAGLIAHYGLRKPGWLAFVVLSIVGSLAFSVPAFILWHLRTHDDMPSTTPTPQ